MMPEIHTSSLQRSGSASRYSETKRERERESKRVNIVVSLTTDAINPTETNSPEFALSSREHYSTKAVYMQSEILIIAVLTCVSRR